MKYLVLLIVLCLSACSAGPHMKVTNQIFTLGGQVDANMKNIHLVGIAGFDEDYPGKYNRLTNNLMYSEGVEEGTPEYLYRVVRVNSSFYKGMLWVADGVQAVSMVAMVPDSFPRVRAGDMVEFRQTLSLETQKDFSKTGEGNIVTKVLCRKAEPDYLACVDTLPRAGKVKGTGPTGRPFPPSVKDYGFTFTPAYDTKGNLLRPFPVLPSN